MYPLSTNAHLPLSVCEVDSDCVWQRPHSFHGAVGVSGWSPTFPRLIHVHT